MSVNVKGRRYTINDVRQEMTDTLYVLTRASKIMKKSTSVLLPHTSRDSGDTHSIEIPMTFNPIDLSLFAPKDELVRNAEFLRLIASGILELIPAEQAEALLDTPAGRQETERLTADRLRKLAGAEDARKTEDQYRSTFPEEMRQLPKTAPGEVDAGLIGVSPSIVSIMHNKTIDDSTRAAMVRNHVNQGLVTDLDKRWVRSNTSDPEIRNIVA